MTVPTIQGGYVRLYRKLQDHPIGAGETACRRWAFADLVMLAAYEPHTVMLKGESVRLARGDVLVSVRFLSHRWRWGLPKTVRFLRCLEGEEMVKRIRNGSGNGSPSVYRIVNYETYQSSTEPVGNGSRNAGGTLAERLRNETKEGKGRGKHIPAPEAVASNGNGHPPSESGPTPEPTAHQRIIDTYYRLFVEKIGRPPVIDGKEGKVVKDLLGKHKRPVDEIIALLEGFFRTGTKFVRENSLYTLSMFRSVYNELLAMMGRGEL